MLLATAAVALATVSFDPATGTGYVAKTDIEVAYGWKEQTFQANARRISFHTEHLASWTWTCVIDGQTVTLSADVQASRAVSSTVLGTAVRKNALVVSGYQLTGLAGTTAGSPAAGGVSCPSGDPADLSGGATDALYADFRTQSEVI